MLYVIGIDLGISCGWALLKDGERAGSGVWDCKPKRHESLGWRPRHFARWLTLALDELRDEANVSEASILVAYEAVERHAGTASAHVHGELRGVLRAECDVRGIDYKGIPVGTIKKLATGKGNATKAAMCKAARKRWGVRLHARKGDARKGTKAEEDEADALFVALAMYEAMETTDQRRTQ